VERELGTSVRYATGKRARYQCQVCYWKDS